MILFVMSFAMTFMLLRSDDYGFSTLPWATLTTLIMMSGEIDYREVFLDSQSSVYILQCVFLVLFFLLMAIVVMNVFVGLAVGDTDEMMKRSKAAKRLHKVCKNLAYVNYIKQANIDIPPRTVIPYEYH